MENIQGQETYRIKDFQGYTRLLVYRRKYDSAANDGAGGYEDTIGIKAIGTVNEK